MGLSVFRLEKAQLFDNIPEAPRIIYCRRRCVFPGCCFVFFYVRRGRCWRGLLCCQGNRRQQLPEALPHPQPVPWRQYKIFGRLFPCGTPTPLSLRFGLLKSPLSEEVFFRELTFSQAITAQEAV